MIKHEKRLRKEQGDVESNDSENIISQQRQEVKNQVGHSLIKTFYWIELETKKKNQESKEVEALQEGQTWQKQSRSRGEKMHQESGV